MGKISPSPISYIYSSHAFPFIVYKTTEYKIIIFVHIFSIVLSCIFIRSSYIVSALFSFRAIFSCMIMVPFIGIFASIKLIHSICFFISSINCSRTHIHIHIITRILHAVIVMCMYVCVYSRLKMPNGCETIFSSYSLCYSVYYHMHVQTRLENNDSFQVQKESEASNNNLKGIALYKFLVVFFFFFTKILREKKKEITKQNQNDGVSGPTISIFSLLLLISILLLGYY